MQIQNNKFIRLFFALVVIGLIVFLSRDTSGWPVTNNSRWSNASSDWYAVHLNNNQVYFGHIVSIDANTLVLKDTYFAEVYDEPTAKATSKSFSVEQAPKQTLRMVKRGDTSALLTDHTLFINRSAVVYWEKLTNGSEVVRNIPVEK